MAKRAVVYVPDLFARIYAKKWAFVGLFTIAFFLSTSVLLSIGITPTGLRLTDAVKLVVPDDVTSNSIAVAKGQGELPVRVEIPVLGIKANVSNPTTTNIDALDQDLLIGAVRYPGTGVPGENGNVLLFGHSSHLPVVHNQAYKAFNDIQNLKEGDPVYVYGEDKVYTYVVATVEHENTASDAIPLDQSSAKLTLATCDNFGTKADRWVVTANLVSIASTEASN